MVITEMVINSVNAALIDYQWAAILKERKGDRYLLIWVGAAEAEATAAGLRDIGASEPLTHDFIRSIIGHLRTILEYKVICEVKDETYHAKTLLKKEPLFISPNQKNWRQLWTR